jgi:Beta-lactamase superfamily domain
MSGDRLVTAEQVSEPRPGQRVAFIMDTRLCGAAFALADRADMLICESTFANAEAGLAREHGHLTAGEAGRIAAESGARLLVLTHFSQRYDHDPGGAQRLADQAAAGIGVTAARRGGGWWSWLPGGVALSYRRCPCDGGYDLAVMGRFWCRGGARSAQFRVVLWVAQRRLRALFCVAPRCSALAFSLVRPHNRRWHEGPGVHGMQGPWWLISAARPGVVAGFSCPGAAASAPPCPAVPVTTPAAPAVPRSRPGHPPASSPARCEQHERAGAAALPAATPRPRRCNPAPAPPRPETRPHRPHRPPPPGPQ